MLFDVENLVKVATFFMPSFNFPAYCLTIESPMIKMRGLFEFSLYENISNHPTPSCYCSNAKIAIDNVNNNSKIFFT